MDGLKAVIFDMDGVLIDSEKHLVLCWQQAAREAGFPFEYEHGLFMRSLDYKLAEEAMKEIFGESFDYMAIRKRRQELVEERLVKYGVEKKPGVDEILEFLKAHYIKCVLATASTEEIAENRLKTIGVRDKFDKIVSAAMVKCGKPEPYIYLYACEQIGERPENCIAIEDSPNRVRSASSSGLRTIMVPDLTQPDEELSRLYYKKADSLYEAESIIAGLLKN